MNSGRFEVHAPAFAGDKWKVYDTRNGKIISTHHTKSDADDTARKKNAKPG